ncbi:MAG: hypothetical protein AMXMBFR7_23790 [Planctomycetota bacterium]
MNQPAPESRPRILVVDDDARTRRLFKDTFKKAGWEVEEAVNGSEALIRARQVRFDLITLDLMMPGFSGQDVHYLLSRNIGYGEREGHGQPRRVPPILIVSGQFDTVPMEMLYGEGVVGVVGKPVDLNLLVSLVRQQLEQRPTPPQLSAQAASPAPVA